MFTVNLNFQVSRETLGLWCSWSLPSVYNIFLPARFIVEGPFLLKNKRNTIFNLQSARVTETPEGFTEKKNRINLLAICFPYSWGSKLSGFKPVDLGSLKSGLGPSSGQIL